MSFLKKPKAPKEKPPTVMPDMEDPSIKAAGRRQMTGMQASTGRASTLLSQSFGGDNYGSGTRFGG